MRSMVGEGSARNFQVFSALDFLAELTQHIPDKGEHLVRYYGRYSHRQRGRRGSGHSASGRDVPSDLNSSPDPADAVPHDGEEKSLVAGPLPVTDQPKFDRSTLAAGKAAGGGSRPGSVSTWARMIQRVYEVDPLCCSQCGGQMKIISCIKRT